MKGQYKLLFVLCFFSIQRVQSQELTIEETISYINNKMPKNAYIQLTGDGFLEYYHKYTYWPRVINGFAPLAESDDKYRVHISEVEYSNLFTVDNEKTNRNTVWAFNIMCKGAEGNWTSDDPTFVAREKCIEETSNKSKYLVSSYFIYPNDGDKYSAEKLLNGLKYLFSLAQEQGLNKRNDNDPFAPGNFNSNKNEIISNNNNGSVKLEKNNDVYYVWVYLGSVRKRFVLDTGASDVLISDEVERELINSGTITKSNYLSPGLYKIADGSVVSSRRILIPKLKIGEFVVKNVKASVGGSNISLLLGKSLLDKFKSWTIDNESQTLKLNK